MIKSIFEELKLPRSTERNYPRDSVIFAQGSNTFGLIIVTKGAVKLVRHTKSGHIVPIHTASAGESVAEASLFSDTYHCDCIAAEHCTVRIIGKASILKLLQTDVVFNFRFMGHLAEQTIAYRRRIELLTMKGAKEKVFYSIADSIEYGSIIQLAGYLGLTHEATYRALSDLCKSGLLKKTGRGKYSITAMQENE
jgi:CRP-like cAMP-binding protein